MLFSAAVVIAALAAAVQALQFDFPASGFAPQIGVPVTLAWSGATGPVTITLKDGPSGNLQDVEVILANSDLTSFTWTPQNLPSGTYALSITDGNSENFSPSFPLNGDTTPTASPSSTTEPTTESKSETTPTMTTPTMTNNTTTMSMTTSATTETDDATTTSTPAAQTTTTLVNNNDSQRLASSLALVIGAFAAFVVFN